MAAPLGFMAAALMLGPSGRWLILLAAPLMAGLALWLALLPPDAAYLVGRGTCRWASSCAPTGWRG